MRNYILSIVLIFVINMTSFGQSPNWVVVENNFQYTMSFVSFLSVNGVTLSSTNDKIAAFVDGECRGVTNLIYVSSEDSYYAYLTIFSNEDGETLNFKIYDSANDNIINVIETKVFEINAHLGDLFQAYSFANPALNKKAEILDLSFDNANFNDKVIDEDKITFDFDKNIDITALNLVFDVSLGANLYHGTILLTSGQNSLDFTNPIQIQVVSEDRSIAKQWTIKISTANATFYKKDAVCYSGGVIKVLSTENGESVFLFFNGTTIATQTINNGEAIFANLENGTYKVKVGGKEKEIIINLKQ